MLLGQLEQLPEVDGEDKGLVLQLPGEQLLGFLLQVLLKLLLKSALLPQLEMIHLILQYQQMKVMD